MSVGAGRVPGMGIGEVFGDLVLPRRCAGCGEPRTVWCEACAGTLGRLVPVVRPGAGRAFALGAYHGAARRAVLAFKERGRRELGVRLGAQLAAGVAELGGADYLVPAPSRRAAVRRRGGAHLVWLAKHCAAALPWRATVAAVLRVGGGRDSVGLDAAQRAANLAGRVRVVPGPPPGSVVLLDDVITTGATAAACRRALAAAGYRVTAVVALTATGSIDEVAAYPRTGEIGSGT
jgi:predicted amidophosphoribosyltransferase